MAINMHIMGPILLLALLGFVNPFKLSHKHSGGQYDNQQPVQPQQPAPQIQQQALLYPNNDYVQLQQQSYQTTGYDSIGLKGAAVKPEREVINKPSQQELLPNPNPQALAYVIVRPINYPQAYGTGYNTYDPYYNNPYGNYNRPPYGSSAYRPPYYPPYNPYGGRPISASNLKDGERQLEGEYQQSKDGARQQSQQAGQPQQPPVAVEQPYDLYAEKKGKLQRLMDKIHSMIPFGTSYQFDDEVSPPNQPQQPQQTLQPQQAQPPLAQSPVQEPAIQPVSQSREPIPEQHSLSQQELHDDREVVHGPEQLHQEQLKEEKGQSKTYREPAGELKRDKGNLNNQSSNLPQDPDLGFASKRTSHS